MPSPSRARACHFHFQTPYNNGEDCQFCYLLPKVLKVSKVLKVFKVSKLLNLLNSFDSPGVLFGRKPNIFLPKRKSVKNTRI